MGNLVSRIAKLCEKSGFDFPIPKGTEWKLDSGVTKALDEYRFDEAIKYIYETYISKLDQGINKFEPWKLTGDELKNFLEKAVGIIRNISLNLYPFIPMSAQKIDEQFKGPKIKSGQPLFPRI